MKKPFFLSADILLPRTGLEKWSVIACDQFTSEKEYWEETEKIAGENPSALHIVFPEAYLDNQGDERIQRINSMMHQYLAEGVFEEHKDSMVYVERTLSNGKVRHGIVGAIDLREYDYRPDSKALIRATEQTVVDRIPPRVKIRKEAPIELPHILLLIDDPNGYVIEPFQGDNSEMNLAYDFTLMQGGGQIKGWLIDSEKQQTVNDSLEKLLQWGSNDMLFAVGDGNHSLAAAKECWQQKGAGGNSKALVEIVNIHDESIEFEPIYRVLFDVEPETVIAKLKAELGEAETGHTFTFVYGGCEETVTLNPSSKLPVGTLQTWLDKYIAEENVKIDYIHGEDTVRNLAMNERCLGFIFEGMKKSELFEAIAADGSLPRKTFSMGDAKDKRYYLEAMRIQD